MFNECLHLFDCTCLNVMFVYSFIYRSNQKYFLIILYVFGSDFYHSLCSYSVHTLFFTVLNMFCVEKQVSEFFATHSRLVKIFVTHLATRQSHNVSREFIQKLSRLISRLAHDSLAHRQSQIAQKQLFKGLFVGNLFPLPSSLKPLFHYFYIKTQSILKVFHSINISKVILNSFHWFWSLDYVLESFVLLVGIFIIGVGKT